MKTFIGDFSIWISILPYFPNVKPTSLTPSFLPGKSYHGVWLLSTYNHIDYEWLDHHVGAWPYMHAYRLSV